MSAESSATTASLSTVIASTTTHVPSSVSSTTTTRETSISSEIVSNEMRKYQSDKGLWLQTVSRYNCPLEW